MINCFVYFTDPLTVGKISQLISGIRDEVKIIKVLDPKQIDIHQLKDENRILVTNKTHLEELKQSSLTEDDFGISIILDDLEDSQIGNVHYINKKFMITRIGSVIDDYISDVMSRYEYMPIKISRFESNFSYPCEVFVKLTKTKYIKILNKNSKFDSESLLKLINKEVESLFVKSTDYKNVNEMFYKKAKTKTNHKDPIAEEISAVESVHKYFEDIGFDPKVITLTKNLHKELEDKYTHKFMKKLFSRFKDLEGSFLHNHSYLTSVIALSVAKKFSWMNYDNKEKIYLGSILHDLGYRHKENALRESLSKSEIENLSEEHKKDILNHPQNFARHLAQVENIHPDVIKIVSDHHGVHGDASYPKIVYPGEVNLIFALFILSHEMAIGLYSISFDEYKIPELLEKICEKFDKGTYKKIIHEFRETVDEVFMDQAA